MMLVLGIVLVIGGLISSIVGIMLNCDPVTLGLRYLAGDGGNPGAVWIIGGIVATVLGVALLVIFAKKNNSLEQKKPGEGRMISGIIAIIALGFLFLVGGSVLIFIGIQLNNVFKHAWDLILSYFMLDSSNSNIGTVLIIVGIVIGLIGIGFMVIGILEAVKRKRRDICEVESKLDKADCEAAVSGVRNKHDEVFSRLREGVDE